MSYILEALKKAEKERRRNSTKALLTGSDTFAPLPRKSIVWPYLLVFALFLNAGLFGWLLGPWSAKSPKHLPSSDLKSTSSGTVKEIFPTVPANSPQPADTESEIVRRDRKELTEGSPDLQSTARALKPPREVMTGDRTPQKATSRGEERPAKHEESLATPLSTLQPQAIEHTFPPQENAAHGEPGGGDKIYRMNELPQSVLSALPDLSLSLHLYNANPSSRLINVKGKTLREGQELSAGLKLEEIRPDGAVFSFQNYRFQIGINSR